MELKDRRWSWMVFLLALSFAGVSHRYFRLSYGWERLSYDVRKVWGPAAQKVLNGSDLYADVWDNKPPIWEFINILVELSGMYLPVFLILIALANFVTAVLLYQLLATKGQPRLGLFAAILYLSTIPVMHGTVVNPRQFANIGILLALVAPGAVISGLSIAAAGLITQYSALVIPVILWRRYLSSRTIWDLWYLKFFASGLALVAISFLLVAGIWGFDAMVAGLRYSFLSLSNHASNHSTSIWDRQILWIRGLTRNLRWLAAVFALALIGAIRAFRSDSRLHRHSIYILILLSPQFLVRTGNSYFIAFLPFLSILAASGASQILSEAKSSGQGPTHD